MMDGTEAASGRTLEMTCAATMTVAYTFNVTQWILSRMSTCKMQWFEMKMVGCYRRAQGQVALDHHVWQLHRYTNAKFINWKQIRRNDWPTETSVSLIGMHARRPVHCFCAHGNAFFGLSRRYDCPRPHRRRLSWPWALGMSRTMLERF